MAIGVVQNPAVPAALRPAGLYLFVARLQALPPMGARMMPYGLGHCERCGIDGCLHILRMAGASAVLCHRCYCDVRDHGAPMPTEAAPARGYACGAGGGAGAPPC